MTVCFLVAFAASPARASCAPAEPLQQRLGDARVAFVGTVMGTSNLHRNAEVAVEKIWLGPRLPARVDVHGGEQRSNVSSSGDRRWVEGRRYLFVLDDATAPFHDDVCSGTTIYSADVAALEPEGAIEPSRAEQGSISPWIALGVLLVGLGALQARRALRRAQSIEV